MHQDLQTLNAKQKKHRAVLVYGKMPKRQCQNRTILSVLKERKKRKPGWSKNNCDSSRQMTSKDNLHNFKKLVKSLRKNLKTK